MASGHDPETGCALIGIILLCLMPLLLVVAIYLVHMGLAR